MKMLLESLVLSHLSYCVTVQGPSLANTLSQRLQQMQNHAGQLCCGLRKYDHVNEFYHRLRWLPLPCFIQFKPLCLMYHQYHQFRCILLDLPICFGGSSTYCTTYFANIPMFCTQRFFRYDTIQCWNTLPSSVTSSINSPFYEYVDGLRQYCDTLFD